LSAQERKEKKRQAVEHSPHQLRKGRHNHQNYQTENKEHAWKFHPNYHTARGGAKHQTYSPIRSGPKHAAWAISLPTRPRGRASTSPRGRASPNSFLYNSLFTPYQSQSSAERARKFV